MKVDGQKPICLFVDPWVGVRGPAGQLLRAEPQGNLLVGRLNRVGAVTNVPSHLHTEKKDNLQIRRPHLLVSVINRKRPMGKWIAKTQSVLGIGYRN